MTNWFFNYITPLQDSYGVVEKDNTINALRSYYKPKKEFNNINYQTNENIIDNQKNRFLECYGVDDIIDKLLESFPEVFQCPGCGEFGEANYDDRYYCGGSQYCIP